MHLTNERQPFQASSALNNKKQLLPSASIGSAELRQVLITTIAIQLLATCFTLPHDLSAYSLPSTSYHNRKYLGATSSNPNLVSSLMLHTQSQRSPALGHHGRNASVAAPWADMYIGPSREKHLAEAISRDRKRRQRTNIKDTGSGDGEGGFENEHSIANEIPIQQRARLYDSEESIAIPPRVPTYSRKRDRVFGRPRRFVGIPPMDLSRTAMTDSRSSASRPEYHGAQQRDRLGEGQRWSFQPILRSEAHPVFIQPVKERVIRRRLFRSRARSGSPPSLPENCKSRCRRARDTGSRAAADTVASTHSDEARRSSDSESNLLEMASYTPIVAEPFASSEESALRDHSKSPLYSPPLRTTHRRSLSERQGIEVPNPPTSYFQPCHANSYTLLQTFQLSNRPGRASSP